MKPERIANLHRRYTYDEIYVVYTEEYNTTQPTIHKTDYEGPPP